MRVLIQRVTEANVRIEGQVFSSIEKGILLLVGIEAEDTNEDIDWLASKVTQLRIFEDEQGVMNKSILETGREILVVSQFTLHAATKKGNRPSYIRAARPEIAIPIYESFINKLAAITQKTIQTGQFGADMKVGLVNDGPVTIWIDSKNKDY